MDLPRFGGCQRFRRAVIVVQKFGRGDGGHHGLDAGNLPEKAGHVRICPRSYCNQQRAVEDQSHAGLSDGSLGAGLFQVIGKGAGFVQRKFL